MTYRFGLFEFDGASGVLTKSGRPVALEPQPSRALTVLLARADQLVTRDELKDAVWGRDTHVDFDRGLAYCISQIRTALGDSGDSPRFVQTIPKKGYRFIAPVHELRTPAAAPDDPAQTAPQTQRQHWRPYAILAAVLFTVAGIGIGVSLRSSPTDPGRAIVAVSIFDNETGLAEYDRLVAGLSDVVVTRLTALAPERVAVVGNSAVLRQPRNIRNLKVVAEAVRADYLILGQLQLDDKGMRFITHFIRLSDESHLKANRLAWPDRDVSSLEAAVVNEFERAVRVHVLGG